MANMTRPSKKYIRNMTRPSKKYIKNHDLRHFNKSEYSTSHGVVLTKYYGTIKKATGKGVPVYNQSGAITHRP